MPKPLMNSLDSKSGQLSVFEKDSATMIVVEPDGLVGLNSQDPEWDRARAILSGIKTTVRMSLAGQVALGMELAELKKALGFRGSGRRPQQKGHHAPFIDPGTWEKWLKAELGISERTAERFIKAFGVVKRRAEKVGEDSDAFKVLTAPPSSLTDADRKVLGEVIKDLVAEESQRELLQNLGVSNGTTSPGGDTSQARKKPVDEEAAASALFRSAINELATVDKIVGRCRGSKNFKAYLYLLPLSHPEPTKVVCLMDLKARLEEVLGGDLDKLLAEVTKAIEAKRHGEAPKRSRRKSKPASRK